MADDDKIRSNMPPEMGADLSAHVDEMSKRAGVDPARKRGKATRVSSSKKPSKPSTTERKEPDQRVAEPGVTEPTEPAVSAEDSQQVKKLKSELSQVRKRLAELEKRPAISADSEAALAAQQELVDAVISKLDKQIKAEKKAEKRLKKQQLDLVDQLADAVIARLKESQVQPESSLPVVEAEAPEPEEKPEKSADSEPEAAQEEQSPEHDFVDEAVTRAMQAGQKAGESQDQQPEDEPEEKGEKEAENSDTITIGNYEFSPQWMAAAILFLGMFSAALVYFIL